MKRAIFLILTIFIQLFIYIQPEALSQPITQTIKGTVFDVKTNDPLPGASVMILESIPLLGTIADTDGNFSIQNARLGRQSIQFSYIGYEPVIIPEVLVTSGKEVVLNIGLEPSLTELEGIVVTPKVRKDQPLNSHASVSARSFSVEETRRYAGGIDDPARLVSAFAGVSVGNVQENAIIVRGNSPKGVSWRLEGVEIPAPHHFVSGNVAGGGMVTLFSSQMLANSDFHTSAFPAEYGNALAGVFDMNLRNGNFDKREYTIQAGTMGLDFSSEGPLSAGSNASYVFNYRYSTLGLLADLKAIPDEQVIKYQDLSYKFNMPTKRAGTFSLWGIGGLDLSTQEFETDSTQWEIDWDRVGYDWNIAMGAAGLSHRIYTGDRAFVHTTFAVTGLKNKMEADRQDNQLVLRPYLMAYDYSGKISLGTAFNYTFGSRHSNQTGVTYKRLIYDLDINSTTIENRPETYQNISNQQGASDVLEVYTQSTVDLSQTVTLNAGVNTGYFGLNEKYSVDPRVGLKWDFSENQALSLGYGKHSQMEDLKIYFVTKQIDGKTEHPNKDLELSKAHHFVLAYDWQVNQNLRLKIEPYIQLLYDIPGIADSSFSMINYKQDWAFDDALENNSIGRNIGIDVTFERFLNNNYYFLVTGSLISSRYKADDGIWRDTRYNKTFVGNVLAGKEFFFGENGRVLGINGRVNFVGGERVSPIMEAESREEERVIFDEDRAFRNQLSSMLYADLSVTYRINRAGHSSVWALQVKNILGREMPEGYNYNYKTEKVQLDKSVIVIPSLSYKIEF
ncbi:TonB-dependent receptor [Rhodohalobacter sp. 614A]|uniref:TonB-dependent receptor n=1 Tax=Rhodohalobacter sp. 614A TaxID=2908649 RepID=UPI001F23B428|nr:carboxypeptidase-like regulatory domain-containing protein [Rhodohalobacter sp. 614A]